MLVTIMIKLIVKVLMLIVVVMSTTITIINIIFMWITDSYASRHSIKFGYISNT